MLRERLRRNRCEFVFKHLTSVIDKHLFPFPAWQNPVMKTQTEHHLLGQVFPGPLSLDTKG